MFPKYYVLEKLLEKYRTNNNLHNYYILSIQHLLRSTGSLFEALIRFGFQPGNIFLTGKIYSAHKGTIEKLKKLGINVLDPTIPDKLGYYAEFLDKDIQALWKNLRDVIMPNSNIIILDDGGYALKSAQDEILKNHSVYGIEQTTSGIRLQETFKKFPVIHVASSAAKTIIEPPIVSEAVRIQLGGIISKLNPGYIGIIGYGHIGKAIARDFSRDYPVGVYDIDKSKMKVSDAGIEFHTSKNDLYRKSEVIIGATGVDISEGSWLSDSNGNKTLISVSSGDVEFNWLVRNCNPFLIEELISPLQDLRIKTTHGHHLTILRGGFVANFTGKPDSSPGKIIQMTRGLLFSAIIQIVKNNEFVTHKNTSVPLSPSLQNDVVSYWFKDQPDRKKNYGNTVF